MSLALVSKKAEAGAPVFESPRYARSLCPVCVLEIADSSGRPLRFANAGIGGGLEAHHQDDGSAYEGVECFVCGVPCQTQEQKFGGVVVQTKKANE